MSNLQPGEYTKCRLLPDGIVFGVNDKNTPLFTLTFDLGEGLTRSVFLFMSDAAAPYTEEALDKLGWNGDFDNPRVRDDIYSEGISLYLKYEEYDGKPRERWNISTGGWKPSAAPADVKARLAARRRATKGPQPSRPSTPPPKSKPAPTPTTPTSGPPTDGPPADTAQYTKEGAWECWKQAAENGVPDTARWKLVVTEIGSGKPTAQMTSEEWNKVAAKAIPF